MQNIASTAASLPEARVVERPKCPFYGMMGIEELKTLIGSKGNACALTCMHHNSHSPCEMEMMGDTPSWDACIKWNREKNQGAVSRILETFVVFPDESQLQAVPKREQEGINAMAWFEHVMRRKYP